MPKVKAGRLKVFQAQFGFHDSIVAAPSQAAALRAWGTHQNLFADGQARVTTDAAAVEAAVSHPLMPLRRALGSNGAFEVEPTSLPVVPDAKQPSKARPARKPEPKPRPEKPPANRSALSAAERAVAELEASREVEEREFRARQTDLETEIAGAREEYDKRREALTEKVAATRTAFGGSWFADNRDFADAIRHAAGRPDAPIHRFPWAVVPALALFNETFREMREMTYLWRRPIRLVDDKLRRVLGTVPETPTAVALRRTLEGLGRLAPSPLKDADSVDAPADGAPRCPRGGLPRSATMRDPAQRLEGGAPDRSSFSSFSM